MRETPSLFVPYSDRIRIDFLAKVDNIKSDDDAARALGVTNFVSAEQTHGRKTVIVRSPERRVPDVDGLVTDAKDLTLMIRIADCQVFAIYDAAKNVAGILHAGWRGVLRGAIPAFFEVLEKEWQSEPKDMYVYAGPSLCQKCAEFSNPSEELPGIDPKFFDGRSVDLQGIANQQLADAGIDASHIERSPDCTQCRSDVYWSYRGDEKAKEGYRNVMACTLLA